MVSALHLLQLAQTAAERAASYIRRVERPSDPQGWTLKGARGFVTEVDRTAEQMIADILLTAEPGGRMVGEELSPEVVTDGLVWIVDPLDGTTNFLHDFSCYAVSIAAAVDGVLEAGVVFHVTRNEAYSAGRGRGAWLGERRWTWPMSPPAGSMASGSSTSRPGTSRRAACSSANRVGSSRTFRAGTSGSSTPESLPATGRSTVGSWTPSQECEWTTRTR